MQITSGKATLSAESHGSGSPDVLLVHAGVTDQRSWHHVIDRLSDHRCLTYDARGYGRTTYEQQDGWSQVDDALAVLDAHDVGSAVVIGCSMGGRTSIDLALTHPERVRALVLIGPAVSGAPEPTYEPEVLALDDEWEAAEERDDQAAVNQTRGAGLARRADGTRGSGRRVLPASSSWTMNARGAGGARGPGERHEDAAAWDRLGEIGVPTLVLIGEHDLRYIKENCAHLAATIPGARLVELPGVAHVPHLEGDEKTLSEITAFVAGLVAAI